MLKLKQPPFFLILVWRHLVIPFSVSLLPLLPSPFSLSPPIISQHFHNRKKDF